MTLDELIIRNGYGSCQCSYEAVLQHLNSLGYNYSIEEIRLAFGRIKYPSLQQQIDTTKGLYN